jgi:hypothetical protein
MQAQRRRRSTKTSKPPQQASLFDRTSHRPRWESLPPDVRGAVTELLTRMMREAVEQTRDVAPTPSARFEEEDVDE